MEIQKFQVNFYISIASSCSCFGTSLPQQKLNVLYFIVMISTYLVILFKTIGLFMMYNLCCEIFPLNDRSSSSRGLVVVFTYLGSCHPFPLYFVMYYCGLSLLIVFWVN